MSKHSKSHDGPIRFLFVAVPLWLIGLPITWFKVLDNYPFFKGFVTNLAGICTVTCTELDVFGFTLLIGLLAIVLIFIVAFLT